ncbi:MAG: hypothetical protein ABIT20_08875 [Gemmatimonadaceae bacterium]
MRRTALMLVASLLVLTSCTDTSTRPSAFLAPPGARYQLSQTGTLDAEIIALMQALFAPELETNALTQWSAIKARLAGGEVAAARARLLTLDDFIQSKQGQMDPPPNNESIPTATARLILYMALYVYSGPTTPVPPQMGIGSDAKTEIVKPNLPALIQTPLLHAAAGFDVGSVTTNTIVVVSQNTTYFQSHCSGPFTTKYCQYPIYYEYHSFPHVRFEKPVRVVMCPVPPGGNYGALPGVDDDELVRAHDKPASPSGYTPGGFPVPGEAIEILPVNPAFDPTHPTVVCSGTVYPQVALFNVPRHPEGVLENALAYAARATNSAASFVGRMLTPKSAYAIDNGVEHLSFEFSQFANLDTIGRPDLRVSQTALSLRNVPAGGLVTISYALTNGGTAPSPSVVTAIRLTPTGLTPGSPITLVPSGQGPLASSIYPLDSRLESVTVRIPDGMAVGSYVIGPVVSTAAGLPENGPTLTDNSQTRELTVTKLSFRAGSPIGQR